jgi:hypothetical protein
MLPRSRAAELKMLCIVQIGNIYEKLGNFDAAYDGYAQKQTGKIPENRIIAPSFESDRITQAVQALLDDIQSCPCSWVAAPAYEGLAGIMRHLGREAEAASLEAEAAIHRRAQTEGDAAGDRAPVGGDSYLYSLRAELAV